MRHNIWLRRDGRRVLVLERRASNAAQSLPNSTVYNAPQSQSVDYTSSGDGACATQTRVLQGALLLCYIETYFLGTTTFTFLVISCSAFRLARGTTGAPSHAVPAGRFSDFISSDKQPS